MECIHFTQKIEDDQQPHAEHLRFFSSFEHFVLFFHAHFFIRQYVLFAQQQIFEKHFQELFILFLDTIMVEHEGVPEVDGVFAKERIVDMEPQFPQILDAENSDGPGIAFPERMDLPNIR